MSRPRKQYDLVATIYDKRGRTLSKGRNSYVKTHPVQKRIAEKIGKPEAIFLHAEIDAINKLKRNDDAHRIVIERYDTTGEPVLAKPCPICEYAINSTGIKIIEFTE